MSANAERALRVARVLSEYADITGLSADDVEDEGVETLLSDLLTDILHYCDATGISIDEVADRANEHFEVEKYEEEATA